MSIEQAQIVDKDDAQSEAGNILIGVEDEPGLCGGQLSLNHKGSSNDCSSATAYVCRQPADVIDAWREALNLGTMSEPDFRHCTIVVEDASVDTCLAAIALERRLKNQTLPDEWITYADLWEQGYTEIAGSPDSSLGALLSSLTHVDLQEDPDASPQHNAERFSRAVTKGTAYINGLFALNCSPFDIPHLILDAPWSFQLLHQQARSRLDYEKLTYQRLCRAAPKLQLAIHMVDSRRKTLVDAILFSEIMLTGTLKNFIRTERSTFTGQGYGFMGLFRPALAGTGNDITFSTTPSAHLDMRSLWVELERLEDERWAVFEKTEEGFARPRGGGKDRELESYGLADFTGTASHQPWYDDKGRRTLLGVPKSVKHNGVDCPGTRLTWADVKQAIWRCYAPTMGLRVRAREDRIDASVKLSENTPEVTALPKPLLYGSALRIADMVRANSEENDIVMWSPTLSAMIASILATGRSGIDDLPSEESFDVIESCGGVIIVTEFGVALLDLSGTGEFPASELKKAASEIAKTVAVAHVLESDIRNTIRNLVIEAVDKNSGANKRCALKAIYSAKLRARDAWEHATHLETRDLVRRFRTLCEQRWQARAKFDNALAEINELENMVLVTSDVRANTILNRLAIYGLPASLAGNILGGLLVLNTQGKYEALSWIVLVVYLLTSVAGMILLRLLSDRENEQWRIDRE